MQIDDELNPEVERFLAQSKVSDNSEAYLYLMGIDALADENPSEIGKQVFESIQQNESLATSDVEPIELLDMTDENKLPLPSSERFCSSWHEDCFETIFSNNDDLAEILSSNAILLQRYQTFINMSDYHTLAKPTASEIFPPYSYLAKGNRLVILKAVQTAQTADPAQAVTILMDNISVLRQQLKSADNLIGKMIYTALISDNLDALSIFIHQQNIAFGHEIVSVSLAERNFEVAMVREFALIYDVYTSLDKNPEFFAQAGFENESTAPKWLVKTVFKPNMSVNEAYLFYENIATRSQLKQQDFASGAENNEQLQIQTSSIRNYAGSILNNIAYPDFDKYIARLFDLNAKIALFNQTADSTELPADLSTIQNPYYGTGNTAYYSDDGKNICLTGPLENDRNQRCLRVKM